jgi:hypothetical protein
VCIAGCRLGRSFADAITHSSVSNTQAALNALSPEQDQALYASFNRRPFSKPGDWDFEPCDRYYDTVRDLFLRNWLELNQRCLALKPEVVTEPEPKILLQNRLQRSRTKISELIPLIEEKCA